MINDYEGVLKRGYGQALNMSVMPCKGLDSVTYILSFFCVSVGIKRGGQKKRLRMNISGDDCVVYFHC